MMQEPKQTWDTRAWLLGILGGTIGGSLAGWFSYPPIQKRFNNLPGHSWIGHHSADVISGASSLITLLVLPGLLSGLARRWTFVWGLLPLCLFFVSVELEDCFENGITRITSFWWELLVILAACLLVSSGPVSLIRWLRVRAARRQEAQWAAYQAMREAASVPQEGVWPPPPRPNSGEPE